MKIKYVAAIFVVIATCILDKNTGFAAQDADFIYHKSSLSSSDFNVTSLYSGSQIAGCSAMTRKPKSALFLMIQSDGEGTIALPAPLYHIPTSPNASLQKLKIGSKTYEKPVIIDGKMAVIEMSHEEFEVAQTLPITLNGASVDMDDFRKMKDLINKCISFK